eukprot:jgi/Orpsp1_1/1181141/evm.model.c7180000076042.1
MNLKFILKNLYLTSLISLALAEKSQLNGDCKEYEDLIGYNGKCVTNDKGKIIELKTGNSEAADVPTENVKKALSQTTIKKLDIEIECGVDIGNGYCYTEPEDMLELISKLTNLEELHFNYVYNERPMYRQRPNINISKNIFNNLKNLKILELSYIKLIQENIEEISSLSNLKELNFIDCDFEKVDLSSLKELNKLSS